MMVPVESKSFAISGIHGVKVPVTNTIQSNIISSSDIHRWIHHHHLHGKTALPEIIVTMVYFVLGEKR